MCSQPRGERCLRSSVRVRFLVFADDRRPTAGARLVLIRAVADFAEAIEEHGATERVLLLSFIEADMAAAPQFRVLQPVQREQRSLELAERAQRLSESALPRIGGELSQDDGRRDGAGFDSHQQSQNVPPMVKKLADMSQRTNIALATTCMLNSVNNWLA